MENKNTVGANNNEAFVDNIEPKDFDLVSSKLRDFFKSKGLIEVAVQHRQSILAACEDPKTLATYDFAGAVWPLPQTGQMHLECEILKDPKAAGFFCYSTSYRQEPNPVPGRHNLCFPMFEFELKGDMDDLVCFEKDLLLSLGYNMEKAVEGNYTEIATLYNTQELEHQHETQLAHDFGPVFFLKNFPFRTNPFFNMRADFSAGTAKKCDVILSGVETIGSAERSCNPDEMRALFFSISNGSYADTLFARFGRKRVVKELEEFLALPFIPRCGGGIGVTRLIRSLKAEGLM